ncbi:MAG: hypothetical protein AMJ56_19825, partial [Anaerolineae bacterium SG8_19]
MPVTLGKPITICHTDGRYSGQARIRKGKMAERIDLNQADRDELASLPEIDDEIAQRIVEYRETVRPFSDVSELSAVEGISEETLQ